MPLLVVSGPPGAGKSTVSRLLADHLEPSALVEGDAFFAFLARGAVPPWLPEASQQNDVVTRAAARAAGAYAAGGYATVYDGVVGPWYLPAFAAASELDVLHYVVLLPEAERCVHRIQARVGHGFGDVEATRHLHRQFAAAPLEERHLLRALEEPAALAQEVLVRLADGRLTYRAPA